MSTISLCMIVKNEEDTLGRCLESIQDLVDEIIIVDTGSTDNTKTVAGRFTSKVYDFPWRDDFSAARNFSFAQATMDYILWLDADDVLLEADRAKMRELKQSLDPAVDIVMMRYNVGFDNEGHVTLSYFRERLLKRSAGFQWQDEIHEYIQPGGMIINSDICITHSKTHPSSADRNLRIYEQKLARGEDFSPRMLFYYALELFYHQRYNDAATRLQQFLETGKGWVEDNIKACFYLGKCYNALQQQQDALKTFLRSFEYDTPRAEICCEIGYCFQAVKDYSKAAFWFELATKLEKPCNNWGFLLHDYWDFIPLVELCVCHYWMGNLETAIQYHDKAAALKPNAPAVLINQQFFEKLNSNE